MENNYASIHDFSSDRNQSYLVPANTASTNNSWIYSERQSVSDSPTTTHNQSLAEKFVIGASYAGVALTFPISLPFCLKHLNENEKAVVSRVGGRLEERESAGYYLAIPGLDTFEKFNTAPKTFVIPPLKVITKDLWELAVQGRAAYKINEPLKLVKATQATGREDLIEGCTKSTIKSVCGRYNYNRVQDATLLRNEVLLEVNRHSMNNWGIQLCT